MAFFPQFVQTSLITKCPLLDTWVLWEWVLDRSVRRFTRYWGAEEVALSSTNLFNLKRLSLFCVIDSGITVLSIEVSSFQGCHLRDVHSVFILNYEELCVIQWMWYLIIGVQEPVGEGVSSYWCKNAPEPLSEIRY